MENFNEKFPKDLKDKIEGGANKIRGLEHRSGRVFGGLIIIVVGCVFLARQFGLDIPYWVFTWKTMLIAIGLFVGVKHSFRGFGWVFPILIGGSALVIDEFYPGHSIGEYWPLFLILMGVFMIIRPRHSFNGGERGRQREGWSDWNSPGLSSEDEIDSTSIFGGTRKNILNKDFKGGDITTFFGGTDINLMQADIQGTVAIDITQVFGGTKLLIPPHWNIKSEVVCLFGSIEDKRPLAKEEPNPTKILVLRGTCIFGGIDIKSY